MKQVITLDKSHIHSRMRLILTVPIILILLILVLFPEPAYAGFWDVFQSPQEFIAEVLRAAGNGLFTLFSGLIKQINTSGVITSSFSTMLTTNVTDQGQTIYDIAKTVHQSAVIPIGHSILALVMLVQVIKISQRVDGSATLPAFKEVMHIFVIFVIFTALINNSLNICVAIYDIANTLTKKIFGFSSTAIDITISPDVSDWGVLIGIIVIAALAALTALIAYLVSFVVGYGRALQLYVLMTFSPIPLALLGFEETRSAGVNFIRNFIALCLAGAIMMFIIVCFPVIMSSTVGAMSLTVDGNGSFVDALLPAIKAVAICVLLVVGLTKSGGWSKELMGG